MRLQNASEEFSRNNTNRQNRRNDLNEIENYDQDDDQVNCPLIFKTCLVALITCGILAFVISFGAEIDNSPDLGTVDFNNCGDHPNVRRLLKSYAYEKIILGLLISAVVISLGLTVFMIYLSYNYCQCFSECCSDKNESQSSPSQNLDINQYEKDLKKRIVSNIIISKSQLHKDSFQQNQLQNKKRSKQHQKEQKIQQLKSQKRRKFKKSPQEIERFNQNYSKYIRNSDSNECDCQCDDCTSCVAYCIGCLWCRSCFDAHHYHFYNSKTQQYTYWITYMVKTFLLGSALAYVIRIYVSLKEMDYCESDNSKLYANNIEVPMIIGIVTAVIDVFGYIHLFVQGTLLDIVQDTLYSQSKSQHSDSDGQSFDDHQKKQAKKYQRSEQSYSSVKKSNKKLKKVEFKKQEQPYQNPTDDNLLRSLKNQKEQRQKQPEQKDTDSFFIRLKTLGNRYLDNIENETDQNEDKYKVKNIKDISSEGSYQDSNKKPRIEVPFQIDKLPKKTVTQMKRQQTEKEQSSLRQSISIERNQNQNKEGQYQKQKIFNKNNYNNPNTKTYGKYGSFNKDKLQQNQNQNNESAFQRLSKFSSNF